MLSAMAAAFRGSESQDLAERLMLALEAGEAAGGDKRGQAVGGAAECMHVEDYPLLDLRVDEHADPVAELRRVLRIARAAAHALRRRACQSAAAPADAAPPGWSQLLLRSAAGAPGGGGSARR